MADDNAKLLIVLEAQSKKLQNQLVDASRTIDRFAAQTNRRFDQMNAKNAASFDTLNKKVGASLGALQRGIATAFAGAAALRGAQQLIDTSTRIQNSLKVTGLAGEELNRVYQSLFASAQKNMAPVESLVTLYSRLGLSQKELGVTTDQLLSFTDNIALALRAQGSTAQESSGALIQLSQAMGSGIVRAEEFNSVLEGAPTILRATAAGLVEAGGSVAKLRQLVIDGKVSSAAFFAAFQAGAVVLEGQVANSEATISQGFVRLQNVLIDLAGKFDQATGTSKNLGNSLNSLATVLENLQGSRILGWIGDLNNLLESSGFLQLESSLKEINAILGALDSAAGAVADSFDGLANSTSDAVAAALGFETAAAAPAELRAKIEELAVSLNKGETDAGELRAELTKLGASPLNLAIQISQIMDLAAAAIAAGGAVAAINGGSIAANGIDLQRSEQTGQRNRPGPVKPVSLSDYKLPTTPKKGAKTPGEKFSDTLDKQREENRLIAERTALQATLNPLINDYGAAQAELTTRQELLSAATKAGIALTPELKATIDELATGYAAATVEAAKLTEAQDLAQQSMADWFDLGKSAARGFIDDLVEGRTAAEALGNVFSKLGDKLLDMGLDALFGGGPSGGFGAIGKLFGFANGGIAANGRPRMFANGGVSNSAAVFGEAGPEAAVPLPDGRRIPVDLRMPSGGSQNGTTVHTPISIQIDATGADAAGLARVEQKVAELKASLPGVIKQTVGRRAKDIW